MCVFYGKESLLVLLTRIEYCTSLDETLLGDQWWIALHIALYPL